MNDSNQSQGIYRKGIIGVVFFVVLGFTAVLTLALTQQTQAGFDCSGNNWTVGNEADLNAAVACYNSQTTAGDYTISFTQNISLTDSTLPISNTINGLSLLIEGAGFVIDGQDILFTLPFFIHSNTKVSMHNITITGGGGYDLAGGIQNEGDLTLINTVITGNYSDRWGSGIYNYWGKLTITNSIISNNSARDFYGGGIYNQQGTVTINSSSITGNSAGRRGGGIYNDSGGNLTINNSTLNDNSVNQYSGGGIYNIGTLTISNSSLSNNSALNSGGGISNIGNAYLNSTTISGNLGIAGGGIANEQGGIFTINSSTLNSNSALGGGGIVNDVGTITITNSTLSSNEATFNGGNGGGGISNYQGSVILSNSTLSDNSANLDGGGIHNYISGTISINNSIIANSNADSDCVNDSGTIIDNGHNLIEDNSCGFTGGSDPLLGPLQDNGGPTFTHAPLPGSPAINAGDTILTNDQRGVSRPQGAADDIGAVEVYYRVYLPFTIR